jgi:23S rRNA pseudouridine1911/1915/1917 synthase
MKLNVLYPPKFCKTKLRRVYENEDLLVIDKPAGLIVFPEEPITEKTLIDILLEEFPSLKNVGHSPRYGIIHRLDKDTSGVLAVAKNNKALNFFQKQFKEGEVVKKYSALVTGQVNEDRGQVETLIGRSPQDRRKQKAYLPHQPDSKRKREAKTYYKVLERFKDYTLLEVMPKTGRKHQIRTHLSYLHHPIAGDKLYGFKNQPTPPGLKRQFLHADYLKIRLLDGEIKEFKSDLAEDLKKVLESLKFLKK